MCVQTDDVPLAIFHCLKLSSMTVEPWGVRRTSGTSDRLHSALFWRQFKTEDLLPEAVAFVCCSIHAVHEDE